MYIYLILTVFPFTVSIKPCIDYVRTYQFCATFLILTAIESPASIINIAIAIAVVIFTITGIPFIFTSRLLFVSITATGTVLLIE